MRDIKYCAICNAAFDESTTLVDERDAHEIQINNFYVKGKRFYLCPRCMKTIIFALYFANKSKEIDFPYYPKPEIENEEENECTDS